MDQQDILCNGVVCRGCCFQLARSVGSSEALTAALCCCASLLAFGSLSLTVSLPLLFVCVRNPLFPLGCFSTSLRISHALNGSLFFSHTLITPSHIFSLVSQWVPGRASLEWPCGVMSSWSRVRKPSIQHPLHPPPLTPWNTHGQKKNLHSYRMLSPQREIVLERQGSGAEVQMKRA